MADKIVLSKKRQQDPQNGHIWSLCQSAFGDKMQRNNAATDISKLGAFLKHMC